MKIIDVSKHNGIINWSKVAAHDVKGVIIRAGYGRYISQKDKTFEQNYFGAKMAGLNVGTYWYSYAETPAEAKQEAAVFLEAIKSKTFDMPVYFDIEEPKHVKLGKAMCTAITSAFCAEVEKAGYFVGIYSFDSFFTTNLDKAVSDRYTKWVARIGSKPVTKCDMWQYEWEGKINGINYDTDVNICYKDFPRIIKNAALNGYGYVPTYNVSAVVNGIDKVKADKIAAECSKLGMTVILKEDKNAR